VPLAGPESNGLGLTEVGHPPLPAFPASTAGPTIVRMRSTAVELLEREYNLRRLDESLAQAREGRGRIVAVAGEAGAGKTVLIERFAAKSAAAAQIYWSACENLSTPEVLLPLRDISRASGESFNLGADNIRVFESVLDFLSRKAKPSVLVIEDVHWADTATLDLIRFLGRRIARTRALILISYRDEDLDVRSPTRSLLGELPAGVVERMILAPLSLAAVTSLASQHGRRGEELFALTSGNPFLVTETLAVEGNAPAAAVRDATLARASRLTPLARDVLNAVSIFPRHAETPMIDELASGSVDAGLAECTQRGMLSLEGGLVRFRHELARRAVEESIASGRRRAMHQRVVDVLKRRSDARASELAHHAERAGDVAAVLEFAYRAGASAARAGAPREAAAHFGAVLEHRGALDAKTLVRVLEDHAEQAYLMGAAQVAIESMKEAVDLRRGAEDTLALGRGLTRLTRFSWISSRRAEAEQYVAEAIEVLEKAPPGPELAWAYSHQSQLDMLASRMDQAIVWGEKALALAQQLGQEEIIIHALANIGSARQDDLLNGTHAELEQSFQLAVKGRYHDHVARASCNLTCFHYFRRDDRSALRYIDRGVAYAAARDLTHWETYLRGWRAMIKVDQGEWADVEEETIAMCIQTAAPDVYRFPALIALARIRVRRGDPDADAPLAAAQNLARSLSELQRSVYIATTLAEHAWLNASEQSTRLAEARSMLRELCNLAQSCKALWVVEECAVWLHLLGEKLDGTHELGTPYREFCEGRWREAAAGWEARVRPYEHALSLSMGDAAAQRQALSMFDRLGAAPAASRLRRAMRAGGERSVPRGPIAPTRANTAGLTRRQVQVLELIDAGLSNAEIAQQLCISPKTAEHHVSAILSQFGAATRGAAIAAARHRGLLKNSEN
jgi:DNA-binding CsgD family transcriptional regulator/tetratricopeptide (TPR) repeat protein